MRNGLQKVEIRSRVFVKRQRKANRLQIPIAGGKQKGRTLLRQLHFSKKKLESAEQEIVLERTVSDFLMRFTTDPILILYPNFTIADVNDAFLKSTGKSRAALVGKLCYKTIYEYDVPCPGAYPEKACPMLETLRTGEAAHVIHESPPSSQGTSFANVVSYPITNAAGQVMKVIEIWQDITRDFLSNWEKRAKALKDDLNRMVHEDRMVSLGKLAASCVHEINNPIQGLLTISHLMKETVSQEVVPAEDLAQLKQFSIMMAEELARCGTIISGLLSFARETPNTYHDICLNNVISAVLALIRHRLRLQNIRATVRVVPQPMMITGDKHQLQQCLLNLIFNAMEAMPQGGEISLAAETDHAGEKACITLRDSGSGIAEEHLPHIFEPFFTTKPEGEGTGLGLSIVYGVVKSHGGDIHVRSEPGKGSTFILHFPIHASFSAVQD